MAANPNKISLTSAITALRKQLKQAADQASGLDPNDVQLRISNIELELTIAAEDSATAGGEVGWWIFKANAGVAMKDVVTHRVKLTLNAGDLKVASPGRTD